MRRFGLMVVGALGLTLGVTGCHTFKYVDLHVTFDAATISVMDAATVSRCKVTVSGADSSVFYLPEGRCPNRTKVGDALDSGVFEYSTFADSGTLTFKLEAFTNVGEKPECILGVGTATIPLSGMTTITGDLKIVKTGPGCGSVTPVANPDAGT